MRSLLSLVLFFPFIISAQTITTVAGTGSQGYNGDGTFAVNALLHGPTQVIIDTSQNIFFADYLNNVIRKITPSGIICTVAGNGSQGYSGDSGPATSAMLNRPTCICFDNSGNLLISDTYNNVIRKVNSTGVISTIAGNGTPGYFGDGGSALFAEFDLPFGVCVDNLGNIFIADASNNCIRKINLVGQISTIAGTGIGGYNGDGIPATAAQLYNPFGIRIDAAGNIYLADQSNNRIRKINSSGIISSVAGTGSAAYGGDGFAATLAQLNIPADIAISSTDTSIYIADQYNGTIRKINSAGIMSTVAGTGISGYSGDGGMATLAQMYHPSGICLDASGDIIVADQLNNRIRRILECSNHITNQPINDTVVSGHNAKYWVTSTMSGVTYQWQENSGTGFVDLTNVLPYSGVNTDTLKIENVIPIFNQSLYRCVLSNGTPCVDTSNGSILIVNNPSEVQALTPQTINIFPNPAHDNIVVELPQQITSGAIELINELGQTVTESNITGSYNKINVAALPTGLYIVRIQVNGQVLNKKIFKD